VGSTYTLIVKVSELVRRLEQDGWFVVRQSGHRIYRHPTKPGQLVVPVHDAKEIATGTLHSILKKAGLHE
jgi:mRNA interferase HicA